MVDEISTGRARKMANAPAHPAGSSNAADERRAGCYVPRAAVDQVFEAGLRDNANKPSGSHDSDRTRFLIFSVRAVWMSLLTPRSARRRTRPARAPRSGRD